MPSRHASSSSGTVKRSSTVRSGPNRAAQPEVAGRAAAFRPGRNAQRSTSSIRGMGIPRAAQYALVAIVTASEEE